MSTRSLKTTRNLSQFAEKKLVGKSHTSAQKTDNAEGIPSNIQISTNTIFGEAVPDSPSNAPTETLWAVTGGTVQYVQFEVTEIGLTTYDADATTEDGGDDPQNQGPHAWSLSLPDGLGELSSDYETLSGSNHSKVGTAPFENGTRVYDTLGALQLVPTNVYINTSNVASNPYIAKIYVWDGSDASTKETVSLSPGAHVDWFVDYYSGIVFFQEYNGKVPYKVEAFIYVGDMADQTTSGTTTLAGCTDTSISGTPNNGQALVYNSATSKWEAQDQSAPAALNDLTNVSVGSPSNNQVLTYNTSSSQWEAQNSSGGGGIERYSYEQTSGSVTAGDPITFTSGNGFNGATPTATDTQVYLNGLLQIGGTQSELNAGTVDYHISSDTEIKMLNDTGEGDDIVILYTTTSFSTGKDILLHTDDAAFDNGRVITGGDGITITKPSSPQHRTLLVTNTGLVQRTKNHFVAAGNHTSSSNSLFTCTGVQFNNVADGTYPDSRIDILKNGVMLFRYDGSTITDGYQLKGDDSTIGETQFKLKGNTSISSSDIITVVTF